jgi:plasmid stabilization system protein ParE
VTLKVQFTPPARAQFLAALAYIGADRPSAARAFQHRVNAVLARLGDSPDSGRVVPEFPDLRFREVIVDPYRFFCRVKGGTVWVVAAWHGAQIPDVPAEVIGG